MPVRVRSREFGVLSQAYNSTLSYECADEERLSPNLLSPEFDKERKSQKPD
jgi:hypothetical protein